MKTSWQEHIDLISTQGREDLALLHLGRTRDGSIIEFVESLQPPLPREQKWVLILSTLKGCPVGCQICDAGGDYAGRLSSAEILAQIEVMVLSRFPTREISIPKFKIQFARMGEPALNDAVLEVLHQLPQRWLAPGLMPCLSTVLPVKREGFFAELTELKNALYPHGHFQLQFSLHTTDWQRLQVLIPYPVLSFSQAAKVGEQFFQSGDRKIGLNFAVAQGIPVEAEVLTAFFNPAIFLIKLTPLNPTLRGHTHGLQSQINPHTGEGAQELIARLQEAGYEVILSLGEPEEDQIKSNCGQFANRLQPV